MQDSWVNYRTTNEIHKKTFFTYPIGGNDQNIVAIAQLYRLRNKRSIYNAKIRVFNEMVTQSPTDWKSYQ